jgi:hypothetical protein
VRYMRNATNSAVACTGAGGVMCSGYQGACRSIHLSAGPMTGRPCHPRDRMIPEPDQSILGGDPAAAPAFALARLAGRCLSLGAHRCSRPLQGF